MVSGSDKKTCGLLYKASLMEDFRTYAACGNFLVTRENGLLSVVRDRIYRTKDGREHAGRRVFNIAGNTEGLEEGDILRADSLDFTFRRVKYTEDGRRCGKIVMFIYGWEKAEEA